MRFSIAFCLLALAAIPLPGHARVARLSVPRDLSAPTVAPIRLAGVAPGTRVEISVIQHANGDRVSVARAVFVADRHGRVDTRTATPVEGSYAGREPLGLFWSGVRRPAVATDPTPGVALVTARVVGVVVARSAASIRPDPKRLIVSTDTPFPGAIWICPADGRRNHPVIVVLGGSEGGSSTARDMAPLFAARGYATLGLPYYDPGYDPADRLPGLPHSFTEIPVDRLAQVREWLAQQPGADVNRIGLWGASKGAEFALIAASRYSWIKAVAAVVPSDLVWEGWGAPGAPTSSFSFGGRPLAYEPYAGMDIELAKAARGQPMDIHRVHVEGRAANPDRVAAARIPVERFRGPLLLLAGGVDQIWPSAEMTANIVAARAGQREPTRAIVKPLANHFIGGPGTDPVASLVTPRSDPAAIAHARAEGWAATFELFDRALRRSTPRRGR